MHRRGFIGGTAATVALGIAGCVGIGDGNSSPDSVSLPDDLPKSYDEVPPRRVFKKNSPTRGDAVSVAPSAWAYNFEVTYLDENDEEQTLDPGPGNVFLTIELAVWNEGGDAVVPPGAEQFGFVNRTTVDGELNVVAPSMKFPEGVNWSDIILDEEHPLNEPTFVNPSTYYHEMDGSTSQLAGNKLTLLFHCTEPYGSTYVRWHSDQEIEAKEEPVFLQLEM